MENKNFELVRTSEGIQCNTFTSLSTETKEEKAKLYNVVNNTTERLFMHINETLEIVDVYCESTQTTDEETGEVRNAVKVIVIDVNGVSYYACSSGITNSIAQIFNIFGMPCEWDDPLKVKVKAREAKKGQTIYFEVVM